MYDRTLCRDQSSDNSNNKIFTTPHKRYESIDPFETKLDPNRTPESSNQTTIFKNPNLKFEQVKETLPNKINQITPDDSANIEKALDSLKSSHPFSNSRKSNKEILANNLSNNNLTIQPTEIMNLPTNQQVSLRDALEIVPYFDGSSKKPLKIFIEACKEAKEMVLNAEANLVKLLRSKLTDEAR